MGETPRIVVRPPAPEPPRPLPAWAIAVGTGFALQILVIAIFVIPQFHEVFVNFGSELPLLTRIIVRAPWLAGLWPLAVALDGWRLRAPGRGGIAGYLVRAVLGTLALIMLLVIAMYLPIFKLGSVIS